MASIVYSHDDRRALLLGICLLCLSGALLLFVCVRIASMRVSQGGGFPIQFWLRALHVVVLLGVATVIVLPNLLAFRNYLDMQRAHADIRSIADHLAAYRRRSHSLAPPSRSIRETAERVRAATGATVPLVDPWGRPYHLSIADDELLIWSNGRDGLQSTHWTAGGIDPWTADEDIVFYAYGTCWAFYRWYGGWAEATTGCDRPEVPSSLLSEP